ncbi:MAG: exodeoxyribonuclease III [Armatimonadota bacterium]
MKVATFNANSIRVRLPIVVEWLYRHGPDILCLQETKVQDVDFPVEAFGDLGYHVVFRGQKAYNGVAIASRLRPAAVSFGLDDGETLDETRLIAARFGRLSVVNTYVPQGRDIASEYYQYKLRWFSRLRRYFERHFKTTDLLLWAGDLNVAPEPIDVYDPEAHINHVCYHEDVRRALAQVVDWGFVDLFRLHCQEPGWYTFWDYRMRDALAHNRGWRLDHLMATRKLAYRCTACYIDTAPRAAEKPSDHTFLVAELNL